ncbi:MAG TPA: DHH family phosphoesterase [Gemmatales bacterium]|nr:DHH family phosphoesterase [Gemmatales bacterium]HMP61370.1 DHH family phosphoesterase [Gemmatales bacterium]
MTPDSSSTPGNGERSGSGKSEKLLRSLAKHESVVLLSHVHPDPDSLGSMLGLRHLIKTRLKLPVIMVRDGLIGRAENQAMVQCLKLVLTPIEEIEWQPEQAVIMVDSQPKTGRHNLPETVKIHGVIDHHASGGDLAGVPFVDVRPNVGATATLVTGYLMDQRLVPPPDVATALFYGIESELTGFPREASRLDDGASLLLYEHIDKDLLAQIRNARLPLSYFETLIQALQNSFIYDKLIVSWAGDLPQAELVAEIADFLIRFEEVEWSFCAGIYRDQLVMSMRTIHATGESASLLQQVVNGMGRAGGHDRRAGGSIPLESDAPSAIDAIRSTLRKRLLQVLDIDECRGQRLVSKKELIQNLQT